MELNRGMPLSQPPLVGEKTTAGYLLLATGLDGSAVRRFPVQVFLRRSASVYSSELGITSLENSLHSG